MVKLLGKYKNGNFTTSLYEDGTKIRKTQDSQFLPLFAESIDVKITNKCSQNCPFCYESCTLEGEHGKLMIDNSPAQKWLQDLHPFTELAINGNDMDHPELIPFLTYLKEKQVIVNITVNQNQFITNYQTLKELYENKLIYGIGVSLLKPTEQFISLVQTIPTTVIHTIVGLLTKEHIQALYNKDLKILILGYKHIGRGDSFYYENKQYSSIHHNLQMLTKELKILIPKFKVVSFDNLALIQLEVKKNFFANKPEEWETFYMGDDGTMTFYIDAVKRTYAASSISTHKEYPNLDLTSQEMFINIKSQN